MAKKGCMKNTRLDKLLGRDGLVRLIDAAGPSLFSKGYERALRNVLGYEITSDCHTAMTGGMPSAALNHAPAGGLVAAESAGADCAGAADGAGPDVAQDDDDGDGDGDPDSDRPRPTHPSPRAPLCNAATPTGAKLSPSSSADCELWRLPVVLQKIPVSKSGWFAGIRAGRYPKPVQLGARAVAWRASDIRALVASL